MSHGFIGYIREKIALILVTALIVMLLCGVSSAIEGKKRVAVVDFENNASSGGVTEDVRRAITDMLTTELWKTQLFTVVERSRIEAIAKENRLAMSGLVDAATAVQIGRLLGVESIITGSITEFSSKQSGGIIPIPGFGGIAAGENKALVTLDVRVVSVETGEVELVVREQGKSDKQIGGVMFAGGIYAENESGGILAAATYNSIQKIVAKLRQMVQARGGGASFHVIQGGGKIVLIDAGAANANVELGQMFVAYVEGSPVLGLKGEILGVDKINLALIKAVDVNPNYSKCEIIKGKTLEKGDSVEHFLGSNVNDVKISSRALAMNGGAPDTPTLSNPTPVNVPVDPVTPSNPVTPQPPIQIPTGDIANTSEEMVVDLFSISDETKTQIKTLHKAGYFNYSKGNFTAAYQQFSNAFELYSGNYLDAYWAARSAHKSGQKANMNAWLDRALSINPNYQPALSYKKSYGK